MQENVTLLFFRVALVLAAVVVRFVFSGGSEIVKKITINNSCYHICHFLVIHINICLMHVLYNNIKFLTP